MPDTSVVEIPKRALFKAAEVCDLLKVQPYVLRSWESEFPDLGVSKGGGGARVYRREDVQQVVRIKNLLLVEGLTLAGARRRIQEESAPVGADAPAIDELIGQNARERLTEVKRGLRSILELLSGRPYGRTLHAKSADGGPRRTSASAKVARSKRVAPRQGSRSAVRRKR